jgi:hypothetical protein
METDGMSSCSFIMTFLLTITKKWRTNVKTQYFIAELHNYYVDRFSNLCRDAPCTQVTSGAPSWVVPVLSPNYISHFDSGVEELPEIDPADEWCLKYLTILYVPSLSEGFDSDGNRLVSIREVNAFTSAIPQDWSLLQALAYWAAGEDYYYRHEESAILMSEPRLVGG